MKPISKFLLSLYLLRVSVVNHYSLIVTGEVL
jgi:hypothetical protein